MNEDRFTFGMIEGNDNLKNSLLEETFEAFAFVFSEISENLNGQVSKVLGGDLNALLSFGNDKIIDLIARYNRKYQKYVGIFLEDYNSKFPIEFSNVDFVSFLQMAQDLAGWIYRRPSNQQAAMVMQFVAVTSEIVEFLHQIYGAVTRSAPVYKYMDIGAKILDYTDRKMFRKMYNSMLKIGDPAIAKILLEMTLIDETLLKYPFPHNYQYYGERVAMADYSYSFKTKYYPKIQITPVDLGSSILKSEYNDKNCSLEFGLGFHAALFGIAKKPSDTVLSFAGTKPLSGRGPNNLYTDICQIMHGPETTYLAAVGVLNEVAKAVEGQIKVVGHSLGGGLMQYACSAIDDVRIFGTGFNSAGLSSYSCYTLRGKIQRNKSRIEHVCASTDWVSRIGKLIGKVGHVDTGKPLSHSIDDLNRTLNKVEISCYV